MKLSAAITIHDRPRDVLTRVFDSMKPQSHDEFIIVLDRTPNPLADWVRAYWALDERTKIVKISGEPGWVSPVRAWNRAFKAVTGDYIYCFSSETVQAEGNIERAKAFLADGSTLVQGAATCSCGPGGTEVNWGGTAPGNLLCDAAHPRPLGFIWAAPMLAVNDIDGYDDNFSRGLWYDDNDFFVRLWRRGLDFLFADAISGIHIHHDRPVLSTPEGQAKIAHNAALITAKFGTVDPWANTPRISTFKPGETRWSHI